MRSHANAHTGCALGVPPLKHETAFFNKKKQNWDGKFELIGYGFYQIENVFSNIGEILNSYDKKFLKLKSFLSHCD